MKKLIIFLLMFSVWENGFTQGEKFAHASILINNGNKYANDRNIDLKIFCKDAKQMQISNLMDFRNARWVPYKNYSNFNLSSTNGEHTIYIRFKSGEDISQSFSDKIILDNKLSENVHIEIVSNNGFINNRDLVVTLKIGGTDATDIVYMMLSNNRSFYGKKWRAFQKEIENWELESGDDGDRYVYAKFKDKAQNESSITSATVIVDTKPPFGGRISINEDAKYTTDQDKIVSLSIFAREVDLMMITEDKNFSKEEWVSYKTQEQFLLKGEDGKKYVYAKFKDRAGNISQAAGASIILDTSPPKDCEIVIDSGANKTTNLNKLVTLSIKVDDAELMQISNNPTFDGARWTKFISTVPDWKLSREKDGKCVVFIRFKDVAENISSIYKDEIILERGFK